MNNYLQKIKEQNGVAAIFITMIVLTSMFLVALAVNTIVQNGLQMSRAHLNSTKAYYAAESGTERILWKIRKSGPPAFNPTLATPVWTPGSCINMVNLNTCTLNCNGDTDLYDTLTTNGSQYKIRYDYNDLVPGSPAIFTSTGSYQDITKRVVQIQYTF